MKWASKAAPHSRNGIEPLESRLLLSGDAGGTFADLLAAAGALTPAADTTERFQWSGYRVSPLHRSDPSGGPSAELQLHFSGTPVLSQTEGGFAVTLEGEDLWVSESDPVVPYRLVRVLLPPQTRVAGVTAAAGEGQVLADGVPLAAAVLLPYGTPAPGGDVAAAYSESFPRGQCVEYYTETLGGYRIAVLQVYPVSYAGASGTVTFHQDIRLSLQLEAGGESVAVRPLAADAHRVLDLVENDSALAVYSPLAEPSAEPAPNALPAVGQYEYVIVTSGALASSFQPLLDHKLARGLTGTIVTTEYIYANYTSSFAGENDSAGRIREFLTDAYRHWGARWVLLGGDVDQVPQRSVLVLANGYTEQFSSDMYFACLDGPYNSNNDAYWGRETDGANGGDVDRAPELFVGRAPVSTSAETARFVAKTIAHELSPGPNPTTAVWIGELLSSSPLTWGATSMDAIQSATMPSGYTNVTVYDRDGTGGLARTVAALNNSPVFANHLGHSTASRVADMLAADIHGLTNEAPFLLYSQGCFAGQFASNDAIGETLVTAERGAWAAILNTHYGWYSPGEYPGGNHYWNLEFWDAIFNEHIVRTGEAHFDSKMDRPSQYGMARWIFFSATLLGDPESPFFVDPPAQVAEVVRNGGANRPSELTSLAFTFSEDVSATVGVSDLTLWNDTEYGMPVDLTGATFSYDLRTQTARWDLSAVTLPPAYYRAVLPAEGIRDMAGGLLDGDGDGRPGGDFVTPLYVALPGDVNLDGVVDLDDLTVIGGYYGRTGMSWAQGDLTYDGFVGLDDLTRLGTFYGRSVILQALAAPTVVGAEVNDGRLAPDRLDTLRITFSEDVRASLEAGALTLYNETLGRFEDLSAGTMQYDAQTLTARWDLSGAGCAAGRYVARLGRVGVRNALGVPLGQDLELPVLVALAGDVNLDGMVDVNDLTILGTFYGAAGKTWSQGDMTYDGRVDLEDLSLMGTHYGMSVNGRYVSEETVGVDVLELAAGADL